jgi:uncharacterized protein (TIGR02271 family)
MALNTPTTINRHRRAIGTFSNRNAAEQALRELRDSGFPMDRVSVVAKDSTHNTSIARSGVSDHADNKADDGAKVGALSGGALGGLTGLLVGIGALAIPGLGPIMLAGAAATALATTAAGGAIGAAAGGLLGGLVGLGIPEERARVYNDRVSAGEYLVMLDGTDTEIAQAEGVLRHRGIKEWGVYNIPVGEAASVNRSTGPMTPAVAPSPAISTEEAVRKFEERRIAPDHEHRSVPPVTPAATTRPTVASREVEPPVANPNAENIKLYEERLLVDKERAKTGEVAIGKHVEVETVRASVSIEKERVIIERAPVNNATVIGSSADAFHDNEAVRLEVYEETPDIRKEAFVREEVRLRKEVEQETVNAEETLRREELSIDTQGHPVVDTRPDGNRVDRV